VLLLFLRFVCSFGVLWLGTFYLIVVYMVVGFLFCSGSYLMLFIPLLFSCCYISFVMCCFFFVIGLNLEKSYEEVQT